MDRNLQKAETFLKAAQASIRQAPQALRAGKLQDTKMYAEAALGLFQEVEKMIARGEVTKQGIVDLIALPDAEYAELQKGQPQLEQLVAQVAADSTVAADCVRPLAEAMKVFLQLAR